MAVDWRQSKKGRPWAPSAPRAGSFAQGETSNLIASLGLPVRLLRWVPHRLADDQKTIRVNLSRELWQVLQTQQAHGWHDIVSLDESWFYFLTDHERIWLAPGEPVPDRERHMIQSPKLMITVAWNPSGFQVVAALPMGTKFNAGFYTTEILQRIKDWRGNHGVRRVRRLVVHADNARQHTANLLMSFMEDNMMTKAPHPPYSPDLASSDFFLFGGMFESPDMHISFHIPWWTSGKNAYQFIPLKPEHAGRLNGDSCLIEDYSENASLLVCYEVPIH